MKIFTWRKPEIPLAPPLDYRDYADLGIRPPDIIRFSKTRRRGGLAGRGFTKRRIEPLVRGAKKGA